MEIKKKHKKQQTNKQTNKQTKKKKKIKTHTNKKTNNNNNNKKTTTKKKQKQQKQQNNNKKQTNKKQTNKQQQQQQQTKKNKKKTTTTKKQQQQPKNGRSRLRMLKRNYLFCPAVVRKLIVQVGNMTLLYVSVEKGKRLAGMGNHKRTEIQPDKKLGIKIICCVFALVLSPCWGLTWKSADNTFEKGVYFRVNSTNQQVISLFVMHFITWGIYCSGDEETR